VRCRNINQALRATDLLLQGGGFGLIAVDLSEIPAETVRYVPLNAWFRFRRAVEDTPTILVLLEQEPNAKTCSSLVLQLGVKTARWTAPEAAACSSGCEQLEQYGAANDAVHPPACLLHGFEIRADVVRSRIQPLTGTYGGSHLGSPDTEQSTGDAATFEAATPWSGPLRTTREFQTTVQHGGRH
jgi:hypothetical protein